MEILTLLKSRWFRVLIVFIIICIGFTLYLTQTSNPQIEQALCSLIHAGPEMAACFMDSTCRSLMSCFASCEDPNSPRRLKGQEQNQHLQHPDSPLPCTVSCLDDYDGDEVIDNFLTKVMSSECAAESKHVDTCFDVGAVRPFSDDPAKFDMSMLVGEWESNATGGWDHWDCQKKIFFPPEESKGKPWHSIFWGTYRTYPVSRGGKPKDNYVHEEIYPNDKEPDGPTWRTRFTMWGTYSEEEWHVFAFDKGNKKTGEPAWVLAQVCIYTPSIKHVDVFSMFISKTANPSKKLRDKVEKLTMEKVGFPLKWVNNSVCDENPDYVRKR